MGEPDKTYQINSYRSEVILGPGDAYLGVKLIAEGKVGDDAFAFYHIDQNIPFGVIPHSFVKDADWAFWRASRVY